MKKYIIFILSACLITAFTFFTPGKVFSQTDSATSTPDGTTPYVSGITTGRTKSIVGGLVGLVSVVIGWRARARANSGTGSNRTGAVAALVLGLIGVILSVIHLGTSAGAVFGSGSGKAGAIVALILGLTGTAFGGLALRSLKTG